MTPSLDSLRRLAEEAICEACHNTGYVVETRHGLPADTTCPACDCGKYDAYVEAVTPRVFLGIVSRVEQAEAAAAAMREQVGQRREEFWVSLLNSPGAAQGTQDYMADVVQKCDSALSSDAGSPLLSERDRLRSALRELLTYLYTVNDDTAVGFSCPMPVDVLETAQSALTPREQKS